MSHDWHVTLLCATSLKLDISVQIKGTFNPRRQGQSVQNPYSQRNCCTNFLIIVCGPFTPRCLCVCGGWVYL